MNGVVKLSAWTLSAALLAACTDSAHTGKPKDPSKLTAEQALAELTRKAGAGDAQAQYELGVLYDKGIGVAKDAAQEVAWFRKSAEPLTRIPSLPAAGGGCDAIVDRTGRPESSLDP